MFEAHQILNLSVDQIQSSVMSSQIYEKVIKNTTTASWNGSLKSFARNKFIDFQRWQLDKKRSPILR